ncbi:uncharacterized protein [Haliotis cracherodii]|uniref:uncharacterized protein n=1 Tax=Haliotis cracherodii TaxID=6455 RepID=UPI0039E74E06
MAEPWAYRPQAWDSNELKEFLDGEGAQLMENDDFEATVLFYGDNGDIEQKTIPITIDHEHSCIRTGEERVAFTQIRYITTKASLMTKSDENIVTFSYRQAESHDINKKTKYVYMKVTSAAQAGKVMNKFRQLQFTPLRAIQDDSLASTIFDAFIPCFVEGLHVKVTDVRSKSSVADKEFVVALDQECLCLFPHPYSTEPDYQVNFWKEEGENVVDKCAVIHATQQMEIVTASYIYHMEKSAVVDLLVKNMAKIKPKPRNSFFDPVAMVKGEQGFQGWPKRGLVINNSDADDQFQYTRDTAAAVTESRRIFLRNFKDNLELAYREGEANMEWHAIWEPNDLMIRQLLENAELLSKKDARSGGLDPDSIDHFNATTEDIVDKMFCQECDAALSSLINLREIFSECSYPEMEAILSDDDYMLLKKLVFKNLYEQPL